MKELHMRRRSFLTAALAFASGSAMPGLLSHAAAQELPRITFMTPFGYIIAFSETMYADTAGIFAKHKLNVTIEAGRGTAMAVQQVAAGRALLSRMGGAGLVKARVADPSLVAVAEITQRDVFFVVSSEDAPIKGPEDMVGKTIGIASAAGDTEFILDMMLAARGVPNSAVSRQVVGLTPAAFEFIKQGRIAGFIATFEAVLQLRFDKQPAVTWSTDEVARIPGQVYVTSRPQLAEKADLIVRFLRGVHECTGVLLAATDFESVMKSMASKYDLAQFRRPDKGLSFLEGRIQQYRPPYQDKLRSSPEGWENAYQLMQKAGLVGEMADQRFYDDTARSLALA